MPLTFQSLRSSSKGNCLLLHDDTSRVLIDCGLRTQRECRSLLDDHADRLDAVLVTHAHGDHICYHAMRVLQKYGTAIHCHHEVARHIQYRHIKDWADAPSLTTYNSAFTVGRFHITPIPLPHEPHCPTFGYVIQVDSIKIVTCTDFFHPQAVADHLVDADFIFIEANHDIELLRRYPNYASHYHLNNRKTGQLLSQARRQSRRPPRCVMLGHLSEQRNAADLALDTVREQFKADGLAIDYRLEVAPRYDVSDTITLS